LLIKYIKSVFWRVTKRLSYTEDARCLKVNYSLSNGDMEFIPTVKKKTHTHTRTQTNTDNYDK